MQDGLEALMLICFSGSWYWSIAKMLATGDAQGKSLLFVALISAGYLCGIGAKLALWQQSGSMPPLVLLYCWNLTITLFDLYLVLRLTRPSRQALAGY